MHKSKLLMILLGLTVSIKSFATPATDLLEKIKKTYPNIPFIQVLETPVAGIYEANFGKEILYVDSTGTYFFPTIVNMMTKQNLGEDRRAELSPGKHQRHHDLYLRRRHSGRRLHQKSKRHCLHRRR